VTTIEKKALENLSQQVNVLRNNIRRNSGYLARQEITELKKSIQENKKRLELYGFKVYSQNDEDGIIEEIFNRIEVKTGTFCEIGVENGLECNSLYLLHKGWRGSWLEGNEKQKPLIESKFNRILKNKRLSLGIGYITPSIINEAIEKTFETINQDPSNLDFLSIDIDGMDIYLLEAIKYKPKVICIEYNAKFPPNISKTPVYNPSYVWSGGDYMGSSLRALADSAKNMNYSLVSTNFVGANAFFVRDELLNDNFDLNLSIEDLYNPPRYWLSFDHYLQGIGHRADFGAYTDLEDW
jgi:hypothetical protein